jgi:hypothetical protein
MRFFVPGAADDEQAEQVYSGLAQWAGAVPQPDPARRVYSISFAASRGEQWTATVGQPLQGVQTREGRSHGKRATRTRPVRSAATVLAIFAENPYRVVTDARPVGDAASDWANPFLAGIPSEVIFFDPA